MNAIVPLTLFEAVRALDLPTDDGLEEFHHDFTAKRLGANQTVAAQIARYAAMARGGKRVEGEEAAAVLRLVSRRGDAGLVFAEAGRLAGRMAVRQVAGVLRLARRVVPLGREKLGLLLAKRGAAEVFGVRLAREAGGVVALMDDRVALQATPNGAACAFFGSGVAELLRTFTSFEGALVHVSCRGRGDQACRWQAGQPAEE